MLKKALLELMIKKGYEFYVVYYGSTVTYNSEKEKFYIDEQVVSINEIEKWLDKKVNFNNIHIYIYSKIVEFG